MHVKAGDKVKIVAGKDRKLGPSTVLRVLPKENRVVVEGRNLVKKHLKGNPAVGTESRIEEVEASIDASNVMLYSEKLQKPVRTQYRFVGAGGALFATAKDARASFPEAPERIKKVRYSPKSEEIFD
jgi:large subunit ribosomal protein L24